MNWKRNMKIDSCIRNSKQLKTCGKSKHTPRFRRESGFYEGIDHVHGHVIIMCAIDIIIRCV